MDNTMEDTGPAWEEPTEIQAISDLPRAVESILWSILRKTEQFEPLEILWDDPLLPHRHEVDKIRNFTQEMKLLLKRLDSVGDALEIDAEEYLDAYFEHERAEWDHHEEYNNARPFSECLRSWTKGYSASRQKSWQNYLVEAAKPIQKKWKLGNEPKEKAFHMLRYEFVKLYEKNAHYRSLFRDEEGLLIPKPKGGLRPNGPMHEEKEVVLWVCDSDSPFGHGDVYSKKPGEEFIRGGNHLMKDGKKIERYALKATEFDRYFCPDSERCGGVLVPRFRDEFATEMVD